ncbi:acyl-CoA N-acyltransferase, partial [Parathielavia appendiculata]
IRSATSSDLPTIISLYLVDFWDEQLMEMLHPYRNKNPADFERFIQDMLTERWLTLGLEQYVDVLVTEGGKIVGFAWWRRSWQDEQKKQDTEGWLTMRESLALPLNDLPKSNCAPSSGRTAPPTQPWLAPRNGSRQKAWMLLTLAVHPAFQKKGLGTMLVKHGLARADEEDQTAWLISREGLEGWYGRLGFVEKGRANIGELARLGWRGRDVSGETGLVREVP